MTQPMEEILTEAKNLEETSLMLRKAGLGDASATLLLAAQVAKLRADLASLCFEDAININRYEGP